MKLTKIFIDSLTYPFLNISRMLVVVGIVILGNLMLILMFNNPLDFRVYDFQKILVPYGNVLNFISVVSLIFVLGYGIGIFKNAALSCSKMPKFNPRRDFSNGLKHLLIILIYFSVPLVLLFCFKHNLYDFNMYFHNCGSESLFGQTAESLFSIVRSVILDLSHFVMILPFGVLFFIFGLFKCSAVLEFVRSGNLSSAFDALSVLHNVGHLGRKLIYAFFILFCTMGIFIVALSIANRFYGGLFVSLAGYSYLIVFIYRFLGLVCGDEVDFMEECY